MEQYTKTMNMIDYDVIAKTIKTMFAVNGEIKSADNYIGEAMEMKLTAKEMADNRVVMSADELKHADSLALTANKMMEKLKAENHPFYPVMSMFWHSMQDEQAEWIAKVKVKHDRYNKK